MNIGLFLAMSILSGCTSPAASNAPDPMPSPGDVTTEELTPMLPCGWRVHDLERPVPVVVTPGATASDAPSDAIVLFDGTNLDEWVGTVSTNKKKRYNPEGKALWKVEDGCMVVNGTGGLISKKAFGDMQLHVEWASPSPPKGSSQARGNSGIYIMGLYEVQILDCYENISYADGMTAGVYGQTPALANACRKPGWWQTYDIIFKAPRFENGQLVSPAYVTVIHNGVLVQNHTEYLGPTGHKKLGTYTPHPEKLPISLQDHNNPVRYRNIWVREL
jgi:hypothetical protein